MPILPGHQPPSNPVRINAGIRSGPDREELVELREAKRRIRTLEQENEVLRRAAAYLSQASIGPK